MKLANRLEERVRVLRAEGRCGLAPYVTAGDGGLDATLAVLLALDAAGASCVELGVPFSDPIADGPVLQAAAQRALEARTSFDGVLEVVGRARAQGCTLPIAIFSYANPLVARGFGAAARAMQRAGADALLVPDLPPEEGGDMRAACAEHGLCPIFFAAPTSSDERVRAAARASRGFLYLVGRTGVTGAETALDAQALERIERVRALAELPLAVGFGLRTPDQVRAIAQRAELAIVGSALVQRARAAFDGRVWSDERGVAAAARAAGQYVRELVRALETPGGPIA